MSNLQVLDGACAAKIEEIRSDATVTRPSPLPLGNVSEAVLDCDALAQQASALGSRDEFSQTMLESFVFRQGDGSSTRGCHGALLSQVASFASLGVEFDCHAWNEGLRLARRAGDGEAAHVDIEVFFREEGVTVACDPRLAQHFTSASEHPANGARVDVAAVDVEFGDA
jgi:hypothetical protein